MERSKIEYLVIVLYSECDQHCSKRFMFINFAISVIKKYSFKCASSFTHLINFRIFRKRCWYVPKIWISFSYCKYDILIHAWLSFCLIMIWQYFVYNVLWRFKITTTWNTINKLYVHFEIDIYDPPYTCIKTCRPISFIKTIYKDIQTSVFSPIRKLKIVLY